MTYDRLVKHTEVDEQIIVISQKKNERHRSNYICAAISIASLRVKAPA